MEIAISPQQTLFLLGNPSDPQEIAFKETFLRDQGAGLFLLADLIGLAKRDPSIRYWTEFVHTFLKVFCRICDSEPLTIPKLDSATTQRFLTLIPGIKGFGYIDAPMLAALWVKLAQILIDDLKDKGLSGREYLVQKFPDWAEVGQIHFHLAENPSGGEQPFLFLATYTTRVSDKSRVQHCPLAQVLKESIELDQRQDLIRLLAPINQVAKSSLFIADLVSSKKIFTTLPLGHRDAYHLLRATESCEEAGISVKLPKAWQGRPASKAVVAVKLESGDNQSFVGINSLFKFRPSVQIDGQELGEDELKKLLEQDEGLIQIRGRWVEFDRKKISELLAKWHKASYLQHEGFSFATAIRMLAGAGIAKSDQELLTEEASEKNFLQIDADPSVKELLKKLTSPKDIENDVLMTILEDHLKAHLRPYQKDGVKWLCLLSSLGLGACLADDMGLGKTIQVISLLLFERGRKEASPSLLLVPASLLGNWQNELRRFAPSIKFLVLHPSQFSNVYRDISREEISGFDLVLSSYSMVSRSATLQKGQWNLIILDEAQAIKNPMSKQSEAVKALASRVGFALTGTPIENNLLDLWSVFDFCSPGLLGKLSEFKAFHKQLVASNSYAQLQTLITPFLLRRKKTDKSVISDLPDKTELKAYCFLTVDQIKLYQATIKAMGDDLKEDNSQIKRKGLILSYLLKFKQICNHPSQMLGDADYAYERSGKFARLAEICEQIAAKNEKMLVFTQFREMTDILDGFLAAAFARKGLVLHGGTKVEKRQELVQEFQNDPSIPYFVLSLKAGGTGLNLTAASHVVHFDRWWNPAVENQATDRAFRIGQKKNVIVHKFICRGTIEEKIDDLINSKKSLSNNVIEASIDVKLTEMSNQELLSLASLEI